MRKNSGIPHTLPLSNMLTTQAWAHPNMPTIAPPTPIARTHVVGAPPIVLNLNVGPDDYYSLMAHYIAMLKLTVTDLIYTRDQNQVNGTVNYIVPRAHTGIGLPRLNNIELCVRSVIQDDIPGDLIETGVWRGGAVIFMRGLLAAYGDKSRTVWVADSFKGLPAPDLEHYPQDRDMRLHLMPQYQVSLMKVQDNFAIYGLLDEQVRFLKGWFKDTLPTAPIERLAIMRLDGDMYESTMQSLDALYPKLSVGGYVIVDDYNDIPACKEAVDDYRRAHDIDDTIMEVDWTGIYWRRSE